MRLKLLSTAAFGALLLPAGTAFAADAIIIPAVTPVVVVEEEARPAIVVTLTQTIGRQDDDWYADTDIEAWIPTARGLTLYLNVGNSLNFVPGNPPPSFSPYFRFGVNREFGPITLSPFAGVFGEDLPGGDMFWEVGLWMAAAAGPVDIEAEVRREQEFGGPAQFVAEATAGFNLGNVITITPGVEVVFPGGPPETTVGVEVELALGERITLVGGVEQELGGDRTLAAEIDVGLTERVTIGAGFERYDNGDPIFIWGGIEIELGN